MKASEVNCPPESLALPDESDQRYFRSIGLDLDPLGRPLHPWRDRLPELEEGRGSYWHWGPNYTVDPIVIAGEEQPALLLIRRSDNGKWALPGGFIDQGESPLNAAFREVAEETTLVLDDVAAQVSYQGPVLDERSRRHAWSDTTAILCRNPERPPVVGGDDASDARWVPLRELQAFGELHGSHAALIEMAIREHGTLREQIEYFGDASEITHPDGGHMGYERLILSLPHGRRIFVKRHDEGKFTDPLRAAHSRRYLRKEDHVYRQLHGQTAHIPDHTELIDTHSLLLDGYDTRDGWCWKAPADPLQRHRYTNDVIDALRSFEHVSYVPFDEVKSSYQTMIDEGWGAFARQKQAIIGKLLATPLEGADELAIALDNLYARALGLEAPELSGFAHYDIRQSNIAWHPTGGVRVVDWSWADHAPGGLDATSFLIDLAKAGYGVSDHLSHFNRDHALLLIGFWLGHSVWPTPTPDQTVRDHQLSSAIAAYRLLKQLD